MKVIRTSHLWLLACVVGFLLLYSSTLRDDSAPAGDGVRIAHFVKMVEEGGSLIPMWSSRNGGEPIFANAERFFLLSYLLSSGESFNFILNLILFILLAAVAASAFCCAKAFDLQSPLASLYALSVVANGYMIETERSLRIMPLSLIICTLLCVALLKANNRISSWVVPILVGVAIYNGFHYAALTIGTIICLTPLLNHNFKALLYLILQGLVLALPVISALLLHRFFNGWPETIIPRYSVSTVDLFATFVQIDAVPERHYLGHQIALFFPALLLCIWRRSVVRLLYLLPLLPWCFFVVAHYCPDFKLFIDASILSNWRHNILFYVSAMMFVNLFICRVIQDIKGFGHRCLKFSFALLMCVNIMLLLPFASSEVNEKTGRALHGENGVSIQEEFLNNTELFSGREKYRVFFDADGAVIPGYRSFRSFSLFNNYGLNSFVEQIGGKVESRPHWSTFPSPCENHNIGDFISHGYHYFMCRKPVPRNFTNHALVTTVAQDSRFLLLKSQNPRAFKLKCVEQGGLHRPASRLVGDYSPEIYREGCLKDVVFGDVEYFGNQIRAEFSSKVDFDAIFFENYAIGWIALVDGELLLPSKTPEGAIELSLKRGNSHVKLYFIDFFLMLGFILMLVIALGVRLFKPKLCC